MLSSFSSRKCCKLNEEKVSVIFIPWQTAVDLFKFEVCRKTKPTNSKQKDKNNQARKIIFTRNAERFWMLIYMFCLPVELISSFLRIIFSFFTMSIRQKKESHHIKTKIKIWLQNHLLITSWYSDLSFFFSYSFLRLFSHCSFMTMIKCLVSLLLIFSGI